MGLRIINCASIFTSELTLSVVTARAKDGVFLLQMAFVLECFSFRDTVSLALQRALFLVLYCFTGSPIVLSDRERRGMGRCKGAVAWCQSLVYQLPAFYQHTQTQRLGGIEKPWMRMWATNRSEPIKPNLDCVTWTCKDTHICELMQTSNGIRINQCFLVAFGHCI